MWITRPTLLTRTVSPIGYLFYLPFYLLRIWIWAETGCSLSLSKLKRIWIRVVLKLEVLRIYSLRKPLILKISLSQGQYSCKLPSRLPWANLDNQSLMCGRTCVATNILPLNREAWSTYTFVDQAAETPASGQHACIDSGVSAGPWPTPPIFPVPLRPARCSLSETDLLAYLTALL